MLKSYTNTYNGKSYTIVTSNYFKVPRVFIDCKEVKLPPESMSASDLEQNIKRYIDDSQDDNKLAGEEVFAR